MSFKMDGGRPEDRAVELYPATHPHLDHGYAVTSHSSQGQTADLCSPCALQVEVQGPAHRQQRQLEQVAIEPRTLPPGRF